MRWAFVQRTKLVMLVGAAPSRKSVFIGAFVPSGACSLLEFETNSILGLGLLLGLLGLLRGLLGLLLSPLLGLLGLVGLLLELVKLLLELVKLLLVLLFAAVASLIG